MRISKYRKIDQTHMATGNTSNPKTAWLDLMPGEFEACITFTPQTTNAARTHVEKLKPTE
jgi:hypothetical protein